MKYLDFRCWPQTELKAHLNETGKMGVAVAQENKISRIHARARNHESGIMNQGTKIYGDLGGFGTLKT